MKSMHIVLITILSVTFLAAICGGNDAARVAGDLKVEGLYFSAEPGTIIKKPSDIAGPWRAVNSNTDTYFPPGGKVGIGVLNPAVPLDVNGDVQISSGNLLLPATSGDTGIIKSGGNNLLHISGTENIFVGINAGNLKVNGAQNTAIGHNALPNITAGAQNSALGSQALFSNYSGSSNTAVGAAALYSNSTGTANTALGAYSLTTNSVGFGNTATGVYSLSQNSSGYGNTANGFMALGSNTVGTNNTASGVTSLTSNSTGESNTAVGAAALYYNSGGNNNAAVGTHALMRNNAGSSNVAVGSLALYSNQLGNNNIANGYMALFQNESGANNTAVGTNAGNATDIVNSNISGNGNTFLGYNTGTDSPFQLNNATAIGAYAVVSQSNSLVLGSSGIRVGIGTSAPGAELDVVGDFRATGIITGNGSGLTNVTLADGSVTNAKISGTIDMSKRPMTVYTLSSGSKTVTPQLLEFTFAGTTTTVSIDSYARTVIGSAVASGYVDGGTPVYTHGLCYRPVPTQNTNPNNFSINPPYAQLSAQYSTLSFSGSIILTPGTWEIGYCFKGGGGDINLMNVNGWLMVAN